MKKLIGLLILLVAVGVRAESYKQVRGLNNTVVCIVRQSDQANIPIAPGNRDYEAYLLWERKNDALPPDPASVPTPSELEKIQAQLNELTKTIETMKVKK